MQTIGATTGLTHPGITSGRWRKLTWTAGALLFAVIALVAPAQTPNFANSAYNRPDNPFDQAAATHYECTRYAWGRAKEVTGVSLLFTVTSGRNGGSWYRYVNSLPRGSTPRANSIADWSRGSPFSGEPPGHVAFVESVSGNNVTISEANNASTGLYDGVRTLTAAQMAVRGDLVLNGYIYLDGLPPNPKFSAGDRVQTAAATNVRNAAGGTLLGQQSQGVMGTVVGTMQGATLTSGGITSYYQWWQIDWDNSALDGWSFEDNLTKISGPTTRTLTIASSNPNSGVTVAVSPADKNSVGFGTTPLTLTYDQNTSVFLSIGATENGNAFQNWARSDGVNYPAGQNTVPLTLSNNFTMTAIYAAPPSYTITTSAGTGGGITPSGGIPKNAGESQTFTASPSANYVVNQWLVDGNAAQTGGNSFTLSNIQASRTVQVTFTFVPPPTRTLTIASSNPNSGVTVAVSPADKNSVGFGTTPLTLTYDQNTSVFLSIGATENGNAFQNWARSDGVNYPAGQNTVPLTLSNNFTMTAIYAAPPSYTITASAGTGGGINPSGGIPKSAGTSQTFTASPNANYVVNQWLVDGGAAQTGGNSFTLLNIQASRTVQVTFTFVPPTGLATLSSPASGVAVSFPQTFSWSHTGTDSARFYFVTNPISLRFARASETFASGPNSLMVDSTRWNNAVAFLGAAQTYYWTIGTDDGDVLTPFADWRPFTVSAPPPAGTIQFSSATFSVSEGAGTATIAATRTGGSAGAVGVSYATANGTAAAGADYTATSATLSWADGDTANKTFTVTILEDSLLEGNETVTLTLSNPSGGATLGTLAAATLTIVDNESGGSVFPLPIPTRPTSFPLSAPASQGFVVAWGNNDSGQTNVPGGLSGVVAVAAGGGHSLALRSGGTVATWGLNTHGQVNPPLGLNGVVRVAAGARDSLALKSDGTVVAWGDNVGGQITVPAGLSGVVAVAGGENHSLALRSDGTVVGWGFNGNGQTTVPVAAQSGVAAVAAGYAYSLALKDDGTVVAWGWNPRGQTDVPAGLSEVVAIAAGVNHCLALKRDGTVVTWGKIFNAPSFVNATVPVGLNGVVAVGVGTFHSLALKSDGTVVEWNADGSIRSAAPAALSGVLAVASGGSHNLTLVSPLPPAVSVSRSGSNLTMFWPDTATGYRVESALSFTPTVTWNNVTGTFQTNSGSISIVLPMTSPQKFYRLVKP